jgi:hypothetical protein
VASWTLAERSPGFTLTPPREAPRRVICPAPIEISIPIHHAFRSGLRSTRPTMPSADFCDVIRGSHNPLSPMGTRHRSPEVSPTTFTAHPPDLQPWRLMGMDFVTFGSLVPPGLPRIRFLFVGSRLCSTLPSDRTSRSCPCASLALHPHQVVQGTYTPKSLNMLGTQKKGPPSGGPCGVRLTAEPSRSQAPRAG